MKFPSLFKESKPQAKARRLHTSGTGNVEGAELLTCPTGALGDASGEGTACLTQPGPLLSSTAT